MLRSIPIPQDIGTPIIDLLVDVTGAVRDLEPPAKGYAKALGELRAVLKMP